MFKSYALAIMLGYAGLELCYECVRLRASGHSLVAMLRPMCHFLPDPQTGRKLTFTSEMWLDGRSG